MSRSPSRDRAPARTGRTFAGSSGGGGGGAFSPASLANGAFWLRAKDNGANGSSVSPWVDQLTYGRNGIVIGTAPTVITGVTPNSGKAVAFAATGHYSIDAALDTGDVATFIYSSQLSTEQAWKAFDSSTSTWWTTNSTTTGYIGVRFKTTKVITEYTITPTSAGPTQNPKNWTFQGSADGSSWTTLDTRTTIAFSGSTAQSFSFSNSTGYLYYRLNVTANNGNASFLSVTGLAMTGITMVTAPTTAEIWAVLYTTTTGATLNGLWSMNRGNNASAHTLYGYNGNVYETFGVGGAAAISFSMTTYPLSQWRLYRVTNDGTNLRTYVDNVLANTQTVSGLGGAQWPISALLGSALYNNTGVPRWTGRMAEVYARTSISDSTDVANMIAYFNTEHGLTVT